MEKSKNDICKELSGSPKVHLETDPSIPSGEEQKRLDNSATLTDFQRQKLEKDAKKNWDLFYKRNGDRFFKNRYWTRREFEELFSSHNDEKRDADDTENLTLLEIGCGCGDFILPLLEDEEKPSTPSGSRPKNMFIYCCDISPQAIDILRRKPLYEKFNPHKIKAFVANITEGVEDLKLGVDEKLVDFVSLIFVLSALDPDKMNQAVENIHSVLKPGGLVLFRDYAINDKSMLRFSERSKICDRFYVRQDGTRAYFFSKEKLLNIFVDASRFECLSIDYVHRETINNATKDKFSRIFLQAKFKKRERSVD